ncbi:MAG: leucyl/phenylalanyl-tRNA--protein transferase [Bdellovibrionales bacterium]
MEEYEYSARDIAYIGLPFNAPTLLKMYSQGIFPWPHEDEPSLWFAPQKRGILSFDELHIPSSLIKKIKKQNFTFSCNQNFEAVMRACAERSRKNQSGTWIIEELIPAYCELQKKGYALSLECWRDQELIGGIYGVWIQNYFSAESMFGLESDVSKLCLLKLISLLQWSGSEWLDIQMVTSVTHQFGGRYVSKKDFTRMLLQALKSSPKLGSSLNINELPWPASVK